MMTFYLSDCYFYADKISIIFYAIKSQICLTITNYYLKIKIYVSVIKFILKLLSMKKKKKNLFASQ